MTPSRVCSQDGLPTRRRCGKTNGLLVIDDSTLDKPHARFMDLVDWHWSGKHKATVRGINLTRLIWAEGGTYLPIDCRVYDMPTSGLDKNDYFQAMLQTAKERGFHPEYVSFDGLFFDQHRLEW